jgi:hypothetical protein
MVIQKRHNVLQMIYMVIQKRDGDRERDMMFSKEYTWLYRREAETGKETSSVKDMHGYKEERQRQGKRQNILRRIYLVIFLLVLHFSPAVA